MFKLSCCHTRNFHFNVFPFHIIIHGITERIKCFFQEFSHLAANFGNFAADLVKGVCGLIFPLFRELLTEDEQVQRKDLHVLLAQLEEKLATQSTEKTALEEELKNIRKEQWKGQWNDTKEKVSSQLIRSSMTESMPTRKSPFSERNAPPNKGMAERIHRQAPKTLYRV